MADIQRDRDEKFEAKDDYAGMYPRCLLCDKAATPNHKCPVKQPHSESPQNNSLS